MQVSRHARRRAGRIGANARIAFQLAVVAIITTLGALPAFAQMEADQDGDGIDDYHDNCLIQPNPLQQNLDDDRYDRCDADFDGDEEVGLSDLNLFLGAFGGSDRRPTT